MSKILHKIQAVAVNGKHHAWIDVFVLRHLPTAFKHGGENLYLSCFCSALMLALLSMSVQHHGGGQTARSHGAKTTTHSSM